MNHRTDHTINGIIGGLEALNVELPAARNALLDRLHAIDGSPAHASGSDTGARGELTVKVDYTDDNGQPQEDFVPVTGVESAMFRREHVQLLITDLDATLNAVALNVANLRKDCQRYMHTPVVKPRCDGGTGRDGCIEWGHPECTNVPGPHRKICDRCRQAETRWRREHGLASREESAA